MAKYKRLSRQQAIALHSIGADVESIHVMTIKGRMLPDVADREWTLVPKWDYNKLTYHPEYKDFFRIAIE